eukprot:c18672_g1_i1.p1 GENE.c18672_g1_i1~~c18672_g1_i1.p1  ORF type:complete len:423 (+),score=136.13 c18672_g1_i1:26-1270(+)
MMLNARRFLCSTVKQQVSGPLNGIRVVDLSRILAGPICTQMLGDLGAEVLKIEKPGLGDDTRQWGPPFANETKESAYFLGLNRNKKSVTLDLKSPKGCEIIKDLVSKSDVVVDNFLPGTMEKLGLSYQELEKINPKIIHCSITGYGPDGPSSHKPGYDLMIEALGGIMSITGPSDGDECKVGVAIIDVMTGMHASLSICAALQSRSVTGRGQHIDCSLLESQMASLVNIGSNYLIAGKEGQRWGTAHESIVPYQKFLTSDGGMIIGAGNDSQFYKLCQILELSGIPEDERFKFNKSRVKNRNILIPILQEKIIQKTTSEWEKLLETVGIPCSAINTISQAFNDKQVIHRQMVQEVEHPTAGKIKVAGIPIKFSKTPGSIRLPPPLLGQHTKEVLKNILNYSENQINELHQNGVV